MHDVPLFPGQAGYTREQLEHEMSRIGTADRAQRIGQMAMAESGPRCLLRHRWRPGPEPVRRAGASAERAGLTSFAGVPARHRIVARRQLRALGLSVIDAIAQANRARQEIARVIVEAPLNSRTHANIPALSHANRKDLSCSLPSWPAALDRRHDRPAIAG